MTDVAQHEATTVRPPTWREWREARDLGSGEQAGQVVSAFVKNHTRKYQEVETHSAHYAPATTEPRNPHQTTHHVRTGSVQDGQFYSKEERCSQHCSAVCHAPVNFLGRSSSAQILCPCTSEVRSRLGKRLVSYLLDMVQ